MGQVKRFRGKKVHGKGSKRSGSVVFLPQTGKHAPPVHPRRELTRQEQRQIGPLRRQERRLIEAAMNLFDCRVTGVKGREEQSKLPLE